MIELSPSDPPGGHGRAEYARMAGAFDGLARLFGIELPRDVLRDLALFARIMERVDLELDTTRGAEERAAIGAGLLAALEATGGTPHPPRVSCLAEVGTLAACLRRRGTLASFRAALVRELETTEALRTTTSDRAFVAHVEDEGRLTVAMMLAVVGVHRNASLTRFLWSIAEIGNLADKLVDVRGDFARGEIAVAPGVRLHASLLRALLERVPEAVRSHPHPPALARWGFSLVAPMIVGARLYETLA